MHAGLRAIFGNSPLTVAHGDESQPDERRTPCVESPTRQRCKPLGFPVAVTEPAFNVELANALRRMHPRWVVRAEQTGRVVGHAGRRPDLTIDIPRAAPLVIETEFEPARTVEDDARLRLGISLEATPDPVETVVAVILPGRLRNASAGDVHPALVVADDLRRAVLREGEPPIRLPESGWVSGGLRELADTLETLAVSPRRLDEAAETLEQAADSTVGVFRWLSPMDKQRVADALRQEIDETTEHQTWRMAASVVANAFLFQDAVASHLAVPRISELRAESAYEDRVHRGLVLDAWDRILQVNYLPIFDIARRIVVSLPSDEASVMCHLMAAAAENLQRAGANQVQDMTGQMFGRMIVDRKFLATFYTLPSSAALLAELALRRFDGVMNWGDLDAVANLRIADFACGTGVLLSAAYRRVSARVRRAGGDDTEVHSAMVEDSLIGADVMPAAAHLTATMLASSHPGLGFGRCGIHLVPYGRVQSNGSHTPGPAVIGSLELLGEKAHVLSLMVRPVERLAGSADELDDAATAPQMELGDNTLDLCIMNPPFTRPTSHETARAAGVPVPSFAGFGNSATDQQAMSKRLRQISQAISGARAGHGNAGMASNFVDLAFAKTKPGGVMALVLPFAVTTGGSWKGARDLLDRFCDDVTFVGLAAHGGTDRAFSADTGMAEVLVVARKSPTRKRSVASAVTWATLRERPASATEAVWAAHAIDSPLGHRNEARFLRLGEQQIGHVQRGEFDGPMLLAVEEPEVAACAEALSGGSLELPRHSAIPLPICRLSELGRHGPVDRDIDGVDAKTGEIRGPFERVPIASSRTPSYPILWGHDAASGRESQLEVEPDCAGRIRLGMRVRALHVWQSAARLHVNRYHQINSQPLGACLTREPVLGGQAWPTFLLADTKWESAVAVWLNTTPGLLARWAVSTRQQQGRASLTVTTLGKIPVVDARELSGEQIKEFEDLAQRLRDRTLLPANEAYRDTMRSELDRAVLGDIMGMPASVFESLGLLTKQWCEEPSVHGGKATRPHPS